MPPSEMLVADVGNVTILIAQEGRPRPSDDDLRELHGLRDPSLVRPLSKSRARKATDEEKLAARMAAQRGDGASDELAALKARVAEIEAAQAAQSIPTPKA